MPRQFVFFLLLLPYLLFSRQIDTFYGPIEVEEPVLLELIDSPAFQRLHHIHQYGVAYYTSHFEEYNRYDHSIGVFAILRANNATIEEQIAGLLHDVSHSAFSHVGDWVFGFENQAVDYQNSVHITFLEESGLAAILEKYAFSPIKLLPKEQDFPALENELPNLCADRIDYNIQGAFYRGFISYKEAIALYQDLRFTDNKWISTKPDLMKKLSSFSLFFTETCWGSAENYLSSRWFANSIIQGIHLDLFSYKDFQYGIDQPIWEILSNQKDPLIEKNMTMVKNPRNYFSYALDNSPSTTLIKSKFRGIDPWILQDGKISRLTELDEEFAKYFMEIKQKIGSGWLIEIHP